MDIAMLEKWMRELTPLEIKLRDWYQKHDALMPQEVFIRRHMELQTQGRKKEDPFYRLDASYRDYECAKLEESRKLLKLDQIQWMSEREQFFIQKHPNYFPEIPAAIDMVSIGYMLWGKGEILLELETGTERIMLTQGDIILFAPNCNVTKKIVGEEDILINVGMSERAVYKSMMESEPHGPLTRFLAGIVCRKNNNSYLVFHTGGDQWISHLFKQAMLEFAENSMESRQIVPLLMQLIFAYMQKNYGIQVTLSVDGDANISRIPQYIYYLQTNYEEFSMKKMAQYFHLSEFYISRFFRKYTGRTIQDTLKGIRLSMAEILLCDTEYSVGEVAEKVGYQDVSHFIKIFSAVYGMTPLQYRKRKCQF